MSSPWLIVFIVTIAAIRLGPLLLTVWFMKRGRAALQAGRKEEALSCALRALRCTRNRMALSSVHNLAGNICLSLGQLERAEVHVLQALVLADAGWAAAARKPALHTAALETRGHSLLLIGRLQSRRGQLAEAYTNAQQAGQLAPRMLSDALSLAHECLVLWGRYAEARDVLDQARQTPPLPSPDMERRRQALIALALARVEAHMGRLDEAERWLDEALIGLETETMQHYRAEAARAWILALRGRSEEAWNQANAVEARLPEYIHDPYTHQEGLVRLGLTAFHTGEFARGKGYLERYLASETSPARRISGEYYLGECCLYLGDVEGARAAYERALAIPIDTYFARCAQGRLEQTNAQNEDASRRSEDICSA